MPSQPSEYLKTKVLTASSEELQLFLYDGAIRFASQARDHLEAGKFEEAHEQLVRSQEIVMQMMSGLDREVNPDLTGRLASLYLFIYRRLVDGNMGRKVEPIDDAIRILRYERETWLMLIDKIRKMNSGSDADPAPLPQNMNAHTPLGAPSVSPEDRPALNIQG
jgi:flagellar protein FliS